MKKLFKSLLLVMLTFTTYGQSDSVRPCYPCATSSRSVINLGLNVWQSTFNELIGLGLIDADTVHVSTTVFAFPKDSLQKLIALSDTLTGTAVFCYYMHKPKGIPEVAVRNCGDTTYIVRGGNTMYQYQLQAAFDNWSALVYDTTNGIAPVVSYSYCWRHIYTGLNETNSSGSLYLQIMAHSVSPIDTTNFQMPKVTNVGQKEGFVAFDLAITYSRNACTNPSTISGELGSSSLCTDFAVPCPKACPQNKQ